MKIIDELGIDPALQSWADRMSRYNARIEFVTASPQDIQRLKNEYGDAEMKDRLQNALLGGILIGMGIMLLVSLIFFPPLRFEGTIPWYVLFPFLATFGVGGFCAYVAFRHDKKDI